MNAGWSEYQAALVAAGVGPDDDAIWPDPLPEDSRQTVDLCDGCHNPIDDCVCAEIARRERESGSCECPHCSASFEDGMPQTCPFCHHWID